jgi:hypothetical protein
MRDYVMKNKHKLIKLGILLCLFFAFAVGNSALAATITFDKNGGAGTNDWNTATNWDPAQVPTASDDVIIGDAFTVTISADAVAGSLTIKDEATLTVGTNALTISGNLTISSITASAFDASGQAAGGVDDLTIGGDVTISSPVASGTDVMLLSTTTGHVTTISGDFIMLSPAGINEGDTHLTLDGTTNCTIPSSITALDELTINKTGASVYLSGDLDINGTTEDDLNITSGTLVTGNNSLDVLDETIVSSGATLDMSGTGTHTLTGSVTNDGTITANGANLTISAIFPDAATVTGTLNVENSTVAFTLTVGANGMQIINAHGATLDFNGAITIAGITLNTDSKTNIDLVAATVGNLTAGLEFNDFTLSNAAAAITLGGDLTVYGDFDNSAGATVTIGGVGNTLSVYGDFDNGAAFAAGGGTVKIYGTVTAWNLHTAIDLEIYGSGTVPQIVATGLNKLVVDRSGVDVTFAAGMTIATTLEIYNGTVTATTGANVFTVTGNTTIGKNGTLDVNGNTTGVILTAGLDGNGTIKADNGVSDLLTLGGAAFTWDFDGVITTDATTQLTIDDQNDNSDIYLPASITDLHTLVFAAGNVEHVYLKGDLTIANTATMTACPGFFVNGNVLTITPAATFINACIVDLTNNSTLVLDGLPTFTGANAINTDASSNLTLNDAGGVTMPAGITALNNFTATDGTGTLTGAAVDLVIYGDFNNSGTYLLNGQTLTVYGDLSNTGTLTLTTASDVLKLYGQLTGTGTFDTDANTGIQVLGAGDQFVLPSGVGTLGTLLLQRGSGMKLSGGLTLGIAATSLTINLGDLDLNGYNITLANVASVISETEGNTIINTSTSVNAYISSALAGSTVGQVTVIGIGISSMNAGPTGIIVRRYPQSASVSGIGNSINRVYYITHGGAAITLMTADYQDADLNGNRPANLKMYQSTSIGFGTTANNSIGESNNPRACAATIAGTSGNYFTLASGANTATSVNYTFDNGAGTGVWNTAANWSPNGTPSSVDNVTIPTGFTVTATVNMECNDLSIAGNSSLYLSNQTLHVHGNLTVSSTSSSAIESDDNTTLGSGATLIVEGNLSNTSTGTIDLEAANGGGNFVNVYLNGTVTNSGGGSILFNGDADDGTKLFFGGSSNTTLPADIDEVHSIMVDKSSGSAYVQLGAVDFAVTGNTTLTVASGELRVEDDYDLTVTADVVIETNGTLVATGSGTKTFNGNITIKGSGEMDLSGIGNRVLGSGAPDIISVGADVAGSTLDITNSTTTINAELRFPNAATLDAEGSTLTFGGTQNIDFANGTFNVDDNTDLLFTSTSPILNFPSNVSDLESLTISGATVLTLQGDLDLAGSLTVSSNGLNIGANTLTVNGELDFSDGATPIVTPNQGVLSYTAGAKLVVNGTCGTDDADASKYWPTFNPASPTDLDLTIGGGPTNYLGALPAAVGGFDDVVMNRATKTLEFAAAATLGTLQINSGTVKAEEGADFTVTGATAIASSGVLDGSGTTGALRRRTLTGALSGAGTIDIQGTANIVSRLVLDGNYTFTGSILTDDYSDIDIGSTQDSDVLLPSTIEELNQLFLARGNNTRTVTLSHNLTINGNISDAEFASGNLIVNGYDLTFAGNFGPFANAPCTITATNSSGLIFNGIADFNDATAVAPIDEITADKTTNITFGGGAAVINDFPLFSELNNLTVSTTGARTLVLNAALQVYGNIELDGDGTYANAILDVGNFNLTIEGDVSNEGTFDLDGTGTTFFRGGMEGMGTYLTDNSTNIVVDGTADQFQLSGSITVLGTLELDRPEGMRLNSNLFVGNATTTDNDVDIQEGNIDLNGYILSLSTADTKINEEAGYFFTNTGATSDLQGFVTTLYTTAVKVEASGIGVLDVAGTASLWARRYPKPVPISGIGLSTDRYYELGGNGALTTLQIQFDNEELNSSASNLKLYFSDSDAFSSYTEIDDNDDVTFDINQNTPTGKGNVNVVNGGGTDFSVDIDLGGTGSPFYFTLAGPPGTGGVLREFVNTSGDGQWSTSTNWDPIGVPESIDDVIIGPYTVTMSGNGASYSCASLYLNHQAATLKPNNNGVNGDDVTLVVLGDIRLTPGAANEGAEIMSVNGYGRLNIQIGDGTTAGVSSTIYVAQDYVTTAGFSAHDFTINGAAVDFDGNHEIRITGDFSMVGNSSFDGSAADIVFYGGSNSGSQSLSIASSAFGQFNNLITDNGAAVTTDASYMEVTNELIIKDNTSFTATNGTIAFPTDDVNAWSVSSLGTLQLWDVLFNDDDAGAGDYTPHGTAYVKGNFTKSGQSTFDPSVATVFNPVGNKVVFNNTSLKEIINTGDPEELRFYVLEVASGAGLEVNSSFEVEKMIDVKTSAELKAYFGSIDMNGSTSPKFIKNASTQTLEFYDLDLDGAITYTSDSWVIKHDLDITASGGLIADNGTITFKNDQTGEITNAGSNLEFFKLSVDGTSNNTKVESGSDFTIANNGTNMSGAGLEVLGNGTMTMEAGSIITFDANIGVASGYPKTISVASTGSLIFGNIEISGAANNDVTTASNFTISGTGGNNFHNVGGGGHFEATAGEITFTGVGPVIESNFPATTIFYSVKTSGSSQTTIGSGDELFIRGNLTVNDFSTFKPGNHDTKVTMDGSTQQIIGGNSTSLDPIQFADFRINKTSSTGTNNEVLLQAPIKLNSYTGADNGEFTLTNGVLNLGSSTLDVSSEVISRVNGAINGGTGTYVIASADHENPLLEDVYFEIDDVPTLYNLQVDAAHTTANDLTVNGTLDLNLADLTIGSSGDANDPMELILNGNLERNAGRINGDDDESRLVLQGTGTVDGGLSNDFFTGGTNTTVGLTVGRAETLGNNLNIGDGTSGNLTINTGINDFNLGTNTLTFNTGSEITMVSGGILAGTNSSVVLSNNMVEIPASMFRNNECYNLSYGANAAGDFEGVTLLGDLTVNGTLTAATTAFNIYTGENILTFGPSVVLPTFTVDDHVVGNLKRTVRSTATTYPIGGGTAATYRPMTLQFSNAGSSQQITVSSENVDPTIGRRGNPKNAVNVLWSITPNGTNVSDSLKMTFQWDADAEETGKNGQVALANASFPAKWTGTMWDDYRNNVNSFNVVDPRVLSMASFPVQSVTDLAGYWGVFNPDANTDADKDRAISASLNRIVITDVSPSPVGQNQAFEATVQLQDQYGEPILASTTFEITLSLHQGIGTFNQVTNVIPAGSNSVTLKGLSIADNSGLRHQLLADTTGSSDSWQPGLSEEFTVLDIEPAGQATAITFDNVKATSMQVNWNSAGTVDGALVIAKADTLLTESEFPVDGQTYVANSIYGAGSSLGDAVVVYNGDPTLGPIEVTGLAPNTKYYFYVFHYNFDNAPLTATFADGIKGIENYKTTAAAQNPNAQTTTGTIDDDATLGSNDTETTSKSIGTNTPVRGTIKSATDVDWFNFTVTNASPNVRAILNGLPADYNVEIYDTEGTRMRRGIRVSTNPEAQVINYLPAGTYLVKIYGVDGAYDASNTYTLKVNTKSDEIFSVTP